MFNFFTEIKNELKIPKNIIFPFNLINIGGEILYIEGKNKLLNMDDKNVSLKIQKCIISVYGDNLKVKELSSDTVVISGTISSLDFK